MSSFTPPGPTAAESAAQVRAYQKTLGPNLKKNIVAMIAKYCNVNNSCVGETGSALNSCLTENVTSNLENELSSNPKYPMLSKACMSDNTRFTYCLKQQKESDSMSEYAGDLGISPTCMSTNADSNTCLVNKLSFGTSSNLFSGCDVATDKQSCYLSGSTSYMQGLAAERLDVAVSCLAGDTTATGCWTAESLAAADGKLKSGLGGNTIDTSGCTFGSGLDINTCIVNNTKTNLSTILPGATGVTVNTEAYVKNQAAIKLGIDPGCLGENASSTGCWTSAALAAAKDKLGSELNGVNIDTSNCKFGSGSEIKTCIENIAMTNATAFIASKSGILSQTEVYVRNKAASQLGVDPSCLGVDSEALDCWTDEALSSVKDTMTQTLASALGKGVTGIDLSKCSFGSGSEVGDCMKQVALQKLENLAGDKLKLITDPVAYARNIAATKLGVDASCIGVGSAAANCWTSTILGDAESKLNSEAASLGFDTSGCSFTSGDDIKDCIEQNAEKKMYSYVGSTLGIDLSSCSGAFDSKCIEDAAFSKGYSELTSEIGIGGTCPTPSDLKSCIINDLETHAYAYIANQLGLPSTCVNLSDPIGCLKAAAIQEVETWAMSALAPLNCTDLFTNPLGCLESTVKNEVISVLKSGLDYAAEQTGLNDAADEFGEWALDQLGLTDIMADMTMYVNAIVEQFITAATEALEGLAEGLLDGALDLGVELGLDVIAEVAIDFATEIAVDVAIMAADWTAYLLIVLICI